MLQQTQVKTVIPYWERWMRQLPTLDALARAPAEKIHKLWEGLGYYARVRNLQKAAQEVLTRFDGQLPNRLDGLLTLPGIGRYTAGAVCSIAFHQPTPILDGNVIRVLTRVFGLDGNPREKQTNAQLWALADELVQQAALEGSPSHFNQSLMELGALICTPRQPHCPQCPARQLCIADQENRVASLPNLARRPAPTHHHFIAYVAQRRGKFLVRQRPAGGVNAHLWEFPNMEVAIASAPDSCPPPEVARPGQGHRSRAVWRPSVPALCTIRHSITSHRITLEAFLLRPEVPSAPAPFAGSWRSLAELTTMSFPSAHKKILAALIRASRPLEHSPKPTTKRPIPGRKSLTARDP